MTFKELYLSGQIPFEEIDRYISRWNNSDDPRTLAKYLGLNAQEEDVCQCFQHLIIQGLYQETSAVQPCQGFIDPPFPELL